MLVLYMQSLSGHSSPVESVAFDSGEVLVLAGASSGVIKLWDLEEGKSKLISPWLHEDLWLYCLFTLLPRMFIYGALDHKLGK